MFCMKSLFKYTLLCIFLLDVFSMYAEDNKLRTDPRLQIIQPSQEAQSLGKFSEIPVDLYTGRTNINIPLLTISHNGIEVPISLSYHGGGIKVDDECGLVGLGWTLNAGGVVNRIVRGMPDNLNGPINGLVRGYNHLKVEEREFINTLVCCTRPDSPMVLLDDSNQRYLLKQMEIYGQLYDENKIDVAQDNYIFHVQNMSGAFVTDTNCKPQYLQSSGGCTISYAPGNQYVLTDINGHKYTFGHHEESNFAYRLENVFNKIPDDINPEYIHKYVSAWWLSSIVSSANDSITFEYITKKQLPPRQSIYGYTQYQIISEVLPDGQIVYTNIPDEYSNYQDPYRRVGLDTIYHQLVSCIKTPHCILQFHYNDSLYYPRLDSLSLYAVRKPNDDDLIESFKLVYTDHTNKAKLSKLTHWGRNNKYQQYTFSYHTINTSIYPENKDHWGYFSKDSKGRFARKSYFGITPQELMRSVYTERYADNENASNNMLKSITYPSGLSVKFIWEPHQFSQLSAVGAEAYEKFKEYDYSNPSSDACNVGGVRIKRIDYTDGEQQLLTKEYSYVDSNNISTGILSYPPRYATKYPMISYSILPHYSSVELVTELLSLRSNGLPYTLNGGGHIEYKQVTECTISNTDNPNTSKVNRIDYYFRTSDIADTSDIDETQYDTLISADMLQLTSMRHRRGDLMKKIEYTDDHKETIFSYQIIEPDSLKQIPGCLFPIADYQESHTHVTDNNGYSLNPYKNFGIVKYRVIPYNKRLTEKTTICNKVTTFDTYTYNSDTYQNSPNANLPKTHVYLDSDDEWCTEHFEYLGSTNKITKYVVTKNGHVIDAYLLKYDTKGRVTMKKIAQLNPTSPVTKENITWDTIETYKYYPTRNNLKEVYNYHTNMTTTYLWSYGGQYPIAEIVNATFNSVKSALGTHIDSIPSNNEQENISLMNSLRDSLPLATINSMTYAPLIGITSYTDPKGYTQYYEYDDFGRIREIYEKVGDKKSIIKSFEYQVQNQK